MNKFSDFGIKAKTESFQGDKKNMSKLLNTEILVIKYKIVPSKFGGNRLDLQIKLNDELRVTWSSSEVLIGMIKDIPSDKFPFTTTIKKVNDQHYEFT